ncbi:MAG TPA: hypothetical protein VJA86_01280 [Candidatus Nanoarchaeia archaeon]|nr:hypothetical protein [Candidatus Nanoarchaeia archaeon]
MADYHQDIKRELGNGAKYLLYLSGAWDDDILRAVAIAQKKHVLPEKARTMSQQQPNVSFQPVSEYRSYLER